MVMEVQGHRGYGYQALANTLAAFRKAAADPCMQSVEFDVRVTADGHLVVTHGPEMPGFCGVDVSTLAQLQAVDLGEGERMPLLADVVEVCVAGGLLMNVEIKPGASPDRVLETMQQLRNMGAIPSSRISSFCRDILKQVMAVEPTVPIGALANANIRPVDPNDESKGVVFEEVPQDFASWFGDHHVEGDSVNLRAQAEIEDPSLIIKAKAAGKRVLVWCPSKDDPGFEETVQIYEKLLALGVDVICTNYPDLIASVVQPKCEPIEEVVSETNNITIEVLPSPKKQAAAIISLAKPLVMDNRKRMTSLAAWLVCLWMMIVGWCRLPRDAAAVEDALKNIDVLR